MAEQIPTPEFSAEELALIDKLRNKGPEDPETRALLSVWFDREVELTNAANTGRANAEFTLKRAKLYYAAGFIDEAWENLEDLRRQATQEDALDLLQAAQDLMDQIDNES